MAKCLNGQKWVASLNAFMSAYGCDLFFPGRFDWPPDEASREKILKTQLRNHPSGSSLVNPATLVARKPPFTSADISAVCRIASMAALQITTLFCNFWMFLCCLKVSCLLFICNNQESTMMDITEY